MKVGLIDVDGHNFPNLCLMKIAAYRRVQGHVVEWWNGFCHYDLVYKSRVFTDIYTTDCNAVIRADQLICGGTGYDLKNKLPAVIEHQYPEYSLYSRYMEAYGFLTRGCPRNCSFCIVTDKEGQTSAQVASLDEFYRNQKVIKLLDPNLLACRDHEKLLQQLVNSRTWVDFTQGLDARLLTADNIALLQKIKKKMVHFAWDSEDGSDAILRSLTLFKRITGVDRRRAAVYVLVNYDTSFEFDLYRVETLRKLGYDPYIMIYDKPTAPQKLRHLQRWVNNKIIWRSCETFLEFDPSIG